ncbi:hypothetical protein J4410_06570 [Candidatus Woesearchaeota archaeon]|nr:hypothetical protein [Candidatus Woesearchaeota archaeon]
MSWVSRMSVLDAVKITGPGLGLEVKIELISSPGSIELTISNGSSSDWTSLCEHSTLDLCQGVSLTVYPPRPPSCPLKCVNVCIDADPSYKIEKIPHQG